MTKSIMIFGAGINQVTLIEAARELGLVSIVLDPNEHPPGRDKANFFYQVAGDDYETTKSIAIKHKVTGIVTGQMEKPLKLMSRLAKEMGYIFHSPEVIECSTNKFLMKQAFIKAGVSCAKGILVQDSFVHKPEFLSGLTFPLIIKPLTAFSSRGVYRIENYNDYENMICETLKYSDDGSYLIEEFIDGQEYSVEAITYKGETTIIQYTEKMITPYPTTVEIGHLQPADLTNEQRNKIDFVVKKAINSLGIDNSASHTEIKWTLQGPVVIEVGPRLGGDFIASFLTKASTGVDMDKAAIQIAIGEIPNIKKTINDGSAILYLTLPEDKEIKTINIDNSLTQSKSIISYNIIVKEGEVIPALTESSKRSGWVITKGSDKMNALFNAGNILQLLKNSIILT